jgi:hypothetical protein
MMMMMMMIIIIIIIRECKNKSDATNNRGNWKHHKIIHKIYEKHLQSEASSNCRKNPHRFLPACFAMS